MKLHITFGLVAVLGALASSAQAVTIYGLTDRDQLVTFDSMSPDSLTNSVFIQGLASNESLLGIDIRPVDNQIYAVGSFGNVYTINKTTGMASYMSTLFDSSNNNPVSMLGTEFGIDFNPVADRLRVVSNSGMNLRINVATGATIYDGVLNQASGTPYVVGTAYSNSDVDPNTGTSQFTVDSIADAFNQQNPPNAGTQIFIGNLGADVSALGDIDILTNGSSNTIYGAFQLAGDTGSQLGMIDVATGAVSFSGYIGSAQSNNSVALRGIAVEAVPEPMSMGILALAAAGIAARRRKRN